VAGRLALVCLLGLFAAPALASTVPAHQTIDLEKLDISFSMPANWGTEYHGPGWKWAATGPGETAQLQITSVPTKASFATAGTAYVSALETEIVKSDPGSSVASRSVSLGPVPSVEVVVRYQAREGAAGAPERFVSNFYVFEHGDELYVFDYSAPSAWIARVQHDFDASIRSIAFPNVA
jgi:hypothetical protein